MRKLAVMDVHLAELRAARQRGHAFTRIEQRLRVEGSLDGQKARELGLAELHAHLRQLLDADTVLAGDRAADFYAKLEDLGTESLRAHALRLDVRVIQDQRMEVAVAGVKHVRAAQVVLL